jgi:hypothetical protein|tara:strand:+ start:303 stop:752 length:450 start_codon:yes stop_codon:yes gene_type:complete
MPSPHRVREIAQYEARHTAVKDVTSAGATLLAADSGKLLSVDTSGGNTTITLPAAAPGLTFRIMIWKTAAAKNLLINSPASAAFYKGGLSWHDPNDADAQVSFSASNGTSEYQLDLDDPDIGTDIQVVCNGTLWHISGTLVDETAPTWA